jgi:head-tail adaptor
VTLTASDLSCVQTAVVSTLPDTVIISRSTQTSDGMGGVNDTWANVGTVAARVSPSSSGSGRTEQIVGGEFLAAIPWVVTMPAGTNVNERDRLIYKTQTFEIHRTDTPRSYPTGVRAFCAEVD